MQKESKNKLITEMVSGAQNIAILPSKTGGVDSFCAGVGLFHLLKKPEKKLSFIYPGQVPLGCEALAEKIEIIKDTKMRDLMITIDYNGTDIEKVQYSSDEGVFFLKLGPVARDFDVSRVKAEVHHPRNDVYFVLGAKVLEDLGNVYGEIKNDIVTSKIVNLDVADKNSMYGHYNFVDPLKGSVSLLAMHTAIQWEYQIDSMAAEAFLAGISSRSQ